MIKSELTKAQKKYLVFICHFIDTWGWPPSFTEIMGGVGVTGKQTVSDALEIIERKGWITRGSRARQIKVNYYPKNYSHNITIELQ